jgi:calcineurin-like phosphoesterase family protein
LTTQILNLKNIVLKKSNTKGNKMHNVWVIADTHFNHVSSMVKWCNRPEDYESQLYLSMHKLTKEDLLIHLGDVCMGKDEWIHQMFIETLNCKKILIRGNHDLKTNNWYMRHGWDFVCSSFADKYFGKYVLFSHRPQPLDEKYDLNIFGHMHNNLKRKNITEENKQILTDKHLLIAVEYTKYKPVNLNHVVDRPDKFTVFNQIKE